MPAFQPTAEQFRALRDDEYGGPIAQVNLLKFKVRAEYGADDPEFGNEETGASAYQRYVDGFAPLAAEVGGTCLLMGAVERYFIGNGDWDAVLVMHFPSRSAFISALSSSGYQAIGRHRDAGLLCQDLITTRPSVANV